MRRKKTVATSRRRRSRRHYELIWLGILKGEVKITQELMISIRSPEWKPKIIQAIIKQKIDPEAALKEAWGLIGLRYCLCDHYNPGAFPKPLASKWEPPPFHNLKYAKWHMVRGKYRFYTWDRIMRDLFIT